VIITCWTNELGPSRAYAIHSPSGDHDALDFVELRRRRQAPWIRSVRTHDIELVREIFLVLPRLVDPVLVAIAHERDARPSAENAGALLRSASFRNPDPSGETR
jgi:hypothetical protein